MPCRAEPYQIGKQYDIFINELSRHSQRERERVLYMRIDLFFLTFLLVCLFLSLSVRRVFI